jgi:hypothetical protein
MTDAGVAFEVLEEEMKAPIGWSKVTGHLVWDVKMDFTRKARWVLDGHKTPNPIGSTYAWSSIQRQYSNCIHVCRIE